MHVSLATLFASLPSAAGRAGDIMKVVTAPGKYYWVSSDGAAWRAMGLVHIGTWATLPAVGGCPVWSEAVVTNMGNLKFVNNGTNWLPASGSGVIYAPTTANMSDSTGTTETVMLQYQFPAASLILDTFIEIEWSMTKSSAQAVTGNIRLGSTGTTADASIAVFSMTASNVSFGRMERYLVETATTVRRQGGGNTGDEDTYDGGSNNQAGTVTIPNISGALYLSATAAWQATAAGGDNTKYRQFVVRYTHRL